MLKRIREMKDQDGFTLIELMVVVLIIAILIAIAIPTFLGLRERAQNRSAQSDLRNALTAAKAYYTDNDTYDGFTATEGAAIEPALEWDALNTSSEGVVSVRDVGDQQVLFSTESASGDIFCMADVDGVTGQGTGEVTDATLCTDGW